jgi:hypothetical protein
MASPPGRLRLRRSSPAGWSAIRRPVDVQRRRQLHENAAAGLRVEEAIMPASPTRDFWSTMSTPFALTPRGRRLRRGLEADVVEAFALRSRNFAMFASGWSVPGLDLAFADREERARTPHRLRCQGHGRGGRGVTVKLEGLIQVVDGIPMWWILSIICVPSAA